MIGATLPPVGVVKSDSNDDDPVSHIVPILKSIHIHLASRSNDVIITAHIVGVSEAWTYFTYGTYMYS